MRFNVNLRVLLALVLAALSLQACNLPNPQSPEPGPLEPTLTPTAEPQNAGQNLCDNPLFPVKPDATWTYTSTGSVSGGYSFTDTISDVRENGFTLTSQMNGTDIPQEWVCTPEGLASLAFGGGVAAGISTLGIQMNLTTSNVQGVILPRTINPGDQWPYSLDFDGSMQYQGTSVDTQGSASLAFNAIGQESVAVPAGTFDAVKIHVDMTVDMQVSYSLFKTPVQFTSASDIWFAPNVGWVKATSAGEVLGNAYNETLELQSYNIP